MKINPSLTLQTVADFIHAEFVGNPKHKISGINEIHMVEAGDMTFVDHPKYYTKALNSKATTIIINKKVDCPKGKALLLSDDPFKDYVFLVNKLRPFQSSSKMISDSAEIGKGTIIQPGAFIGNNVKIGKNCLIHSNVSIYDHCEIGNNVIIHSNTTLGGDAFYFQKRKAGFLKLASCGRVIIEDNVEIGCNCTVDKGVSGDTTIGKGSKLDNHIHVGHDTVIGHKCLIASGVLIAGCVRIEDEVVLWGQVAIQKDLTIHKGAVVLASSGVSKSLEGNKVYYGKPAVDARSKWKEIAYIRRLPELFENKDKN